MDDLHLAEMVSACSTFEEFLERHIVAGEIMRHPLFWPQASFVADHLGRIKVDYLGKVETLRTDFQVISERVGLRCGLPKANMSKGVDTSNITASARDIIRRLYSKDFELFGYK